MKHQDDEHFLHAFVHAWWNSSAYALVALSGLLRKKNGDISV
jgi:hypothetical protein